MQVLSTNCTWQSSDVFGPLFQNSTSILILRKAKIRVIVKRFPNRECSNHLMSVNQIQLRGFRTRALGTLLYKMNNDYSQQKLKFFQGLFVLSSVRHH